MLLAALTCDAQTAASRHDVLITELMADPSPQVGLPPGEFVEITNVSPRTIDLKGWMLADGNSTGLVAQPLAMPPGARVILCSRGYAAEFTALGTSIGLGGFPSLDNDGDRLTLVSPEGRSIHSVAYDPSWYGNPVKSAGGWSLEMIDPGSPCLGAENWTASRDPSGGTPGKTNSVSGTVRDSLAPRLLRTYTVDSLHLVAVFDESLDSANAADPTLYAIDKGIGRPTSARPLAPMFQEVSIRLATPMRQGTVYHLSARMQRDCAGNGMTSDMDCRAGLPGASADRQIRINEILFNPLSGGSDYVELLNLGPGILDAYHLYMARSSIASPSNNPVRCAESPFLIFPGDHVVFTADIGNVIRSHPHADEGTMLQTDALPTLPDDSGSLAVMDAAGRVLDGFHYNARMHHPLIYDREGVSLERVDPLSPTQDPSNWHSASTDAGYGSPTRRNSQYHTIDTSGATIEIRPETLSPDMDGFDDLLTVSYRFRESGHSASVAVYDPFGRKVRTLARNVLCGSRGYFRWNGLDEGERRMPSGPYCLVFESMGPDGRARVWRKPIVIAYRR
jgi:hypothetical protein